MGAKFMMTKDDASGVDSAPHGARGQMGSDADGDASIRSPVLFCFHLFSCGVICGWFGSM